MNEELWKAITTCDRTYDGKFVYAVRSTGIFCRPSCKSKNPKRENVALFSTVEEAVGANYRPCKRCRPDHILLPDEDVTKKVVAMIDCQYREKLSLSMLAKAQHISPYHLHRTFKRVAGKTPAEYLRDTRLKAAMEWLKETDTSIAEISTEVGFPNPAHFSTVFLKHIGMVPSTYRSQYR